MDHIFRIRISDLHQASQVLILQREAYLVEAGLIGFTGIPPLQESLHQLMQSEETFVGYGNARYLSGFIALETAAPGEMTISRLCVSPVEFRKGIASRLLAAVFSEFPGIKTFRVTTGAANTPAVNFYSNSGFISEGSRWVANGKLQIACFVYSR